MMRKFCAKVEEEVHISDEEECAEKLRSSSVMNDRKRTDVRQIADSTG